MTATDALLTKLDALVELNRRRFVSLPMGGLADKIDPVRYALDYLTYCTVSAVCGKCDLTDFNADTGMCSFCYQTMSHLRECNKIHPPLRGD
tara:strand:- start:202 stop:477 length:276 start_codon:yes stop_codon:yes gene_type:complete